VVTPSLPPKSAARKVWRGCALVLAALLGPLALSATVNSQESVPWYAASREPTGLAPDPAKTPDAVIQVYGARAVRWRGTFSLHTWITFKEKGAPNYERYEVMGFGVQSGQPAIRRDRMGPDNYWFGNKPELFLDKRGPEAEALIPKIREAIKNYPYPDTYVTWPGPNSNTFTAYIGREVPELGLNMPSNAVGKDFLPNFGLVAMTPSGTGAQFSLLGVAGILVGAEEGLEVNVLGFALGIDVLRPALKLPGIGRVGFD
jgi:hypothetical protein